jgi:hypothetical protein
VPPTIFPAPLVVLGTLLASIDVPLLAVAGLAVPLLLYPGGIRHAIARRSAASLIDPYVQLAQETSGNVGFLEGLWRFRGLVPDRGAETTRATGPARGTETVP